MAITVTPLGEHVGVEVAGARGADLVDLAAAVECHRLLARHGVVVYREVDIDDDDLVAFSRLLGDVVPNRTKEHRLPEIATITLDPAKTNDLLAYYRRGNFLWHIDGMTDSLPQRATLLSAKAVDPSDGDTEFASTYAAYDALTEAEQRELDGLMVEHSFATSQALAHPEATEQDRAGWDRFPPRSHPLVWHRQDGRRSLLIGATAGQIVGWSVDQSRALLDRLAEWVTRPEFVLRHSWRRGDLVVFDNTGLLHRALPFQPTSPRVLHRTTLVGVEPTGDAEA